MTGVLIFRMFRNWDIEWQLDNLFGLLHADLNNRLRREKINTFDENSRSSAWVLPQPWSHYWWGPKMPVGRTSTTGRTIPKASICCRPHSLRRGEETTAIKGFPWPKKVRPPSQTVYRTNARRTSKPTQTTSTWTSSKKPSKIFERKKSKPSSEASNRGKP